MNRLPSYFSLISNPFLWRITAMKRIACLSFVVVFVAVLSLVRAEDKPAKPKTAIAAPAAADRAKLQMEFAESMSGATLVGYFTTNGSEDKGLKEEKYKLKSVKKLPAGDLWLFEYQYG